jgi:hypothetical protein
MWLDLCAGDKVMQIENDYDKEVATSGLWRTLSLRKAN